MSLALDADSIHSSVRTLADWYLTSRQANREDMGSASSKVSRVPSDLTRPTSCRAARADLLHPTSLDPETAASAIRNLNNIQVSGRPLRVSSAGEDPKMERQGMHGGVAPQRLAAQQSGAQPMGGPGPQGWGGMQQQQQQQAPPLQQPGSGGAGIGQGLPPGQPLPPGMQATDAISQTLAALPPSQLLDIMSQMKVSE